MHFSNLLKPFIIHKPVLPSTSFNVLPDNFDLLPPPPEFSCPEELPEEPVKEIITVHKSENNEQSIKKSDSFEKNQTEKLFNQLEEDASRILNRIKSENLKLESLPSDNQKKTDAKVDEDTNKEEIKVESKSEITAVVVKNEKGEDEEEKPRRRPKILKSFEHTDLKTIRTGKAVKKQPPIRKNLSSEKK